MTKIDSVYSENDSQRIDSFVASEADVSRSRAAAIIGDGGVLVNGKAVSKNYRLSNGDFVEITVPDNEEYEVLPENIPLDIVYEDDDLLVVDKPKGMVVHPAAGHYSGTLVNAVMYHCGSTLSGINGVLRPGIVHRIDMNTSGLLMIAKNDNAHQSLAKQISEHSFVREYEAVVYGNVKADSGRVDAPIGRHPVKRKQMAVNFKNGKPAITNYRVLERFKNFTHLRLVLETGRTHQIRVHMAYIGNPVAGDDVYGPKKVIASLGGQCLHAKKLGFVHPSDGRYMEFESELPDYFKKFIIGCRL